MVINCEGTNMKITAEGQRHLGAVIGLETFKKKCVQEKIDLWIKELRVLCKIAWCKSQPAYYGFFKGFKHKPIYFMKTIPNIKSQLKQLDDVIRTEFIAVITGGINCFDIETRLMFLPLRFGDLETPILSESAQREYDFSTKISKDLI